MGKILVPKSELSKFLMQLFLAGQASSITNEPNFKQLCNFAPELLIDFLRIQLNM